MASNTFALDVRRFGEKAGIAIDTVTRRVLFEMSVALVMKSPVGNASLWKVNQPRIAAAAAKGRKRLPKLYKPTGYVGGRFRANWQYGTDVIPEGALDEVDRSGNATIRRLQGMVPAKQLYGSVHYFANNLPYAQRIEDGWSTQAPSGVVKLTVLEFHDYLNRAVDGL